MMTAQNAYKLAATKRSGMTVRTCVEYDSVFVFCFVPRNYNDDTPMVGLIAIDKNTGQETYFNPIDMPLDEYNRGKQIDISIFE